MQKRFNGVTEDASVPSSGATGQVKGVKYGRIISHRGTENTEKDDEGRGEDRGHPGEEKKHFTGQGRRKM